MKILYVSLTEDPNDYGGAQIVTRTLVNSFSNSKDTSILFTNTTRLHGECQDDAQSPITHEIKLPFGAKLFKKRKFKKLLSELQLEVNEIAANSRPDIVHAHGLIAGLACSKLEKFIWTDHGELKHILLNENGSPKQGWFADLARRVAGAASEVTFVSAADAEQLEDQVLDVEIIENGVIDQFKVLKGKEEYDIVFDARLNVEKGIYDLLDVQSLLYKQRKTKLLIAATSGSVKPVNDYIKKKKIKGVTIEEYSDDAALRGEIYILPSYMEATSLGLLRAMMLGRPIISTDVGGTSLLLKHEQTALLHQPRDIQQLVSNINLILDEPKLSKKLATNARKEYLAKHQLKHSLKKYRELYLLVSS